MTKTNLSCRFLAFALLTNLSVAAADVYTFSVPPAVTVGSPARVFSGWGYSLDNQSSAYWLVTTGLSSGTVQYATPSLLFDFPDLAPGTRVTETYDPIASTGLFELAWNASVPSDYVNAGTFDLTAEWWSGNPAAGGIFVTDAPSASASYSASLVATPEPATGRAAILGLLALAFAAFLHRKGSMVKQCGSVSSGLPTIVSK